MQNPPLELLKFRAFPEVAAALRDCTPVILERFQVVVRHVLPAAEQLTLAQVRNSLPLLLQQIAEAVEADQPAATHELMDLSQIHGESRYHEGYNVNELLIEYHLIRRIIIEEVSGGVGRPLETAEHVALNLGVDTALRRGVVTFADFQAKKLQQISDVQAHYLAFLAHDLRGGLNGTLLMIEVLKREMAAEQRFAESMSDLEVMRRSILDTVATMDRFVSADRLRRGAVRVCPAPLNLNAMAAEQVAQFAHAASEKRLTLACDVPDAARVVSDKEVVGLVVANLVDNAVKFTRKGSVRVSAAPASRGGWVLSVADEGPGIAPDRVRDIFKPFRRGEAHGTRGPGLGLTVAKDAADLLGATLTVKSEVGKGSIFSLELPASCEAGA